MRTVRSSGCISGGGCTWSGGVPGPRGGVPGLGGYTWSRGKYLVPGGCTWVWGVYLVLGGIPCLGVGVPGPGSVPGQGVSALGIVPGQVLPLCGQTNACKNITIAASLRTVTTRRRQHSSMMRTARLPTVRAVVASTRCQYQEWVDISGPMWGRGRGLYILSGTITHWYTPTICSDTPTPGRNLGQGIPTPSPYEQAHACENISCPVVGCTIHTHGNRTWRQRILFGSS